MTNIGDKIRQRREELGWTQNELAKRMGYTSKSTINKVEKGINDVSQSNIVKYAEVLRCKTAYLMGWEDEERLNTENAEFLIMLNESPKLKQLIRDFNALTPNQQETVLALIHSMISDKHN